MDVSANNDVGDDAYVIGVDFGTLSARALVVRVRDGAEAGTAVSEYPHGAIDRSLDGHGELPPDWALQDPADWTRALGEAVPAAVRDAGIDPAQVIGIATHFTASTCMPVLADGTPLCQLPGLAARPAGYRGIYQAGSYRSREYLAALAPRFAGFADEKLAHPISPLGARAGGLTPAAAALTGLPEGIAVAIGNVDAHVTVPAAGPVAAGKMVAIMGTSTCHVMNGAELAEVPGMCGAVDGGIVAGMWGYEAGQSGGGDIFAWFARNGVPGEFADEARRRGVSVQQLLDENAVADPVGAHGPIALD